MTPAALAETLGKFANTPIAQHPRLTYPYACLLVAGQRGGTQVTNLEVNGLLWAAAEVYIHSADTLLFVQPQQVPGRIGDSLSVPDRDLILAVRDSLQAEVPGGDCEPFERALRAYQRAMNPAAPMQVPVTPGRALREVFLALGAAAAIILGGMALATFLYHL